MPEARTVELYETLLRALHKHGGEMTTAELQREAGDHSSRVSNMTSDLVNHARHLSPVARVRNGVYTLTPWAKAELDAGRMPPHPDALLVLSAPQDLEEGRQEALVEALVTFLETPIEAIQSTPSREEMLQAMAAEYPEITKGIEISQMQNALDLALQQVDQKTGGSVYYWADVQAQPVLFSSLEGGRASIYSESIGVPHAELLSRLAYSLKREAEILPSRVDRNTHIVMTQGEQYTRIALGRMGEWITKRHVLALHQELQAGEQAHIYALGRVTAEASALAEKLGVILSTPDMTCDVLAHHRMFAD